LAIEVTVLGAGIFGLSAAWAMARRGARVRVIEKRRIGAGASGGVVGALTPHVPGEWNAKKEFQFQSLILAESWWAEAREASGLDPGYARIGRLQPLADQKAVALAEARVAAAATHWRGHAAWRVVPLAEFPGWGLSSPTGLAVHDTLSARLHPARALAALAAALRAAGGEIAEGAEAPPRRGIVVHATGWEGLRDLSNALGRAIGAAEKGQAMLLSHDARGLPQLYLDALHLVPHDDGTLALGSTSEAEFGEAEATDARLDALHARAAAALPALADASVIALWAGLRPRAASRAPLIGPWPGQEGEYVLNGGFKIGFGLAPKLAESLADLILDGRDTIPESFRPG
jgi:glycine/D-amino acid oxidase-like deaminating enzyme